MKTEITMLIDKVSGIKKYFLINTDDAAVRIKAAEAKKMVAAGSAYFTQWNNNPRRKAALVAEGCKYFVVYKFSTAKADVVREELVGYETIEELKKDVADMQSAFADSLIDVVTDESIVDSERFIVEVYDENIVDMDNNPVVESFRTNDKNVAAAKVQMYLNFGNTAHAIIYDTVDDKVVFTTETNSVKCFEIEKDYAARSICNNRPYIFDGVEHIKMEDYSMAPVTMVSL